MELSMYSSRNYTEEKKSGWLQKTDSRNIQKGYLKRLELKSISTI